MVDDILVDRRGEPAIAALTPRVQVLADDELDPLFPAAYATIVELETRDGRRYRERIDHALGTLENPVPPERIEAKFADLAGPAIGDRRAAAIQREVAGLDRAPSLEGLAALIGG